ncbi:hypothetical protein EVAR_83815_1 [Eumeta japonica]|uniref:Uncharacterized protein n=1 Tax=Eumeta variegata TaxID=151549 RepID=A0A4C1WEN3_EUMVA|nr:hypothetical protein EVAR_83815_1 [Eumeta japonica]
MRSLRLGRARTRRCLPSGLTPRNDKSAPRRRGSGGPRLRPAPHVCSTAVTRVMLNRDRCVLVQDLVTALPLANGHGNVSSHFVTQPIASMLCPVSVSARHRSWLFSRATADARRPAARARFREPRPSLFSSLHICLSTAIIHHTNGRRVGPWHGAARQGHCRVGAHVTRATRRFPLDAAASAAGAARGGRGGLGSTETRNGRRRSRAWSWPWTFLRAGAPGPGAASSLAR